MSNTSPKHKTESDSEPEEGVNLVDEESGLEHRKDQFCIYTNERELRNIELIRYKI
jgi:hypothetical protein